ncbi:hypothetical protein FXO38_14525, partial [Capsicum annuum]
MVDVSPQSQLIPNLPDVIALQCLARIPHSHHPKLFLISKSWRSTLNSSALYNTQSLLRTTETFLYLNLCINFTFHWYTLISHKLFPVCSMPVKSIRSDFAVLGSKIYVIGRSISEIPSNNMWVFLLVYAIEDRGGVVYDVKECQWESVLKRLDLSWRGRASVVGRVLYCYDYLG